MSEPTQTDDLLDAIAKVLLRCWIFGSILLLFWFGVVMLAGIILFSGFLFAWLATGRKFFVYPVPVGGVSFIIGWLALAIGSLGFWGKN